MGVFWIFLGVSSFCFFLFLNLCCYMFLCLFLAGCGFCCDVGIAYCFPVYACLCMFMALSKGNC